MAGDEAAVEVIDLGGVTGVGRANGTFGELLQGRLPGDDLDFLVTLPITQSSTATFVSTPERDEIRVVPAHKRKSQRLVGDILRAHGRRGGGVLTLVSTLPEGKGFASSSADLVATARAVGGALGIALDAVAIEDFLRRIEPSDGVMHDGIVSFYHREVRLREWLGCLPPLTIVAHDEGGEVDTVGYNRIPKPYTAEDKREYARLLSVLSDAVRARDLAAVGAVSSRSVQLDARYWQRPRLDALRRVCADIDGLGLVLAHSGTVTGILVADADPDYLAKIEHATARCRALGGPVSVHRSLCVDDECGPLQAQVG
ncbi:kinase [Solihabitans fulvus]|uniref:Kinase n=1 Tax=Solihabitans fulvus TaxID=1892852 RepID=A0A5B2WVF1_9PSEU|nr:kinase [Solihabitans fulvus]KAA2254632.1 kinase [Solihabitans fulvus]